MAISIDTVYQTILNVANKEQRGYVTPQEFNLYANQAQMDIFEQYFYDINQFSRAPGSDNEYSDMLSILEEKLLPFKKFNQPMASIANTNELTLPANVYRLGAVFKTNNPDSYKIEVSKVQEPELQRLFRTSLLKPTDANPVYVRTTTAAGLGVLKMHPSATIPAYSITNVTCDFITKPTSVNWNYTEINGVAMYNSSTSVDFSLHASEEADLVFKILQLVGISIEAMDLYQVASQEEIKDIQQEKQ